MLKHYEKHLLDLGDLNKDSITLGSVNYKDRFGQTALDEAVRQHQGEYGKSAELIQLLKDHGAAISTDFKYGMQLCKAGVVGDKKRLEALYQESYDRDSKKAKLDTSDWDGRTALHLVAVGPITKGPGKRHVECLKWLIKQGADRTVKDCNDDTPVDGAKAALKELMEGKKQTMRVKEAIKKLQEIIDILLKKPDAQGWFKGTAAPKTNGWFQGHNSAVDETVAPAPAEDESLAAPFLAK